MTWLVPLTITIAAHIWAVVMMEWRPATHWTHRVPLADDYSFATAREITLWAWLIWALTGGFRL